jgi:hypothetical protein
LSGYGNKSKYRHRGIGVNFCPECGSQNIEFKEYYDLQYECYYICHDCRVIFYVNDMAWKYGKREYD